MAGLFWGVMAVALVGAFGAEDEGALWTSLHPWLSGPKARFLAASPIPWKVRAQGPEGLPYSFSLTMKHAVGGMDPATGAVLVDEAKDKRLASKTLEGEVPSDKGFDVGGAQGAYLTMTVPDVTNYFSKYPDGIYVYLTVKNNNDGFVMTNVDTDSTRELPVPETRPIMIYLDAFPPSAAPSPSPTLTLPPTASWLRVTNYFLQTPEDLQVAVKDQMSRSEEHTSELQSP